MRVDALPRLAVDCLARPDASEWLHDLGLRTANDFLALPGPVVSGHVGRNVSRVQLGGRVGYLKREHRVRLRDRFRNARAGFGWVSISRREQTLLAKLDDHDLPGPRWLACGEIDGEAFLLIEEAADAIELRALPKIDATLLKRIGEVIARMHHVGIDQPDLFAKHFLIQSDTGALTILDWQRATIMKKVPMKSRLRSLAAFRATMPESLLDHAAWATLIAAYERCSGVAIHPATLDLEVQTCRRRPSIRKHAVATTSQELIRINGEKVCAIPAIADELHHPEMIESLYDPANQGRRFRFHSFDRASLTVSRYRLNASRIIAALRGKSWRSPELKLARMLFHLERFGIRGPRLLAYGQQTFGPIKAGSFLLFEPFTAMQGRLDATQIEGLVQQLHSAGVVVREELNRETAFGMVNGEPAVVDASLLRMAPKRARR